MSLFLTLNRNHTLPDVSIVKFEQVNAGPYDNEISNKEARAASVEFRVFINDMEQVFTQLRQVSLSHQTISCSKSSKNTRKIHN